MNKQACNAMPIMNCLLTHENNKYTAHECISKYTNTILMNNKNCIYAVVRLIYLIIRYMIHIDRICRTLFLLFPFSWIKMSTSPQLHNHPQHGILLLTTLSCLMAAYQWRCDQGAPHNKWKQWTQLEKDRY